MKIKEVEVKTLKEALEKQDDFLEENENYTFRIIELFLRGYILEVHEEKRENLIHILDGFYDSFKEEIRRLEKINNEEDK